MVSKIFEKLVKNRLADYVKIFNLFLDFRYGFKSCHENGDLLAVISTRIAGEFNRSEAARGAALDISTECQ